MDAGPFGDGFYSQFEKANPFLGPVKEKMHRELKKTYKKGTSVKEDIETVQHPSFQAALDHALSIGDGAKITLTNFTGSAVVRGDKILLPAPAIDPGTHVLPAGKVRVSDAVKDKYLNRLREGFGDGCITEEEFDARQNMVLAATMEDDLAFLVRDLPVRAQKKEVSAPAPESPPGSFIRWTLTLLACVLPAWAGIAIAGGGSPNAAAVLALLGGLAALLATILGGIGKI